MICNQYKGNLACGEEQLRTAELLSRCLYEEFGSHLVGFAEVVIYAGQPEGDVA